MRIPAAGLSAGSVNVSNPATLVTNDLVSLNSSGSVYFNGVTVTVNQRFKMFVDGDMYVDSSTTFNGAARGYGASSGPGAGTSNAAGGSHAGCGSQGGCGLGSTGSNRAYDSIFAPVERGSGGFTTDAAGGFGGGAIRIIANQLVVNGTIRTDGGNGASKTSACRHPCVVAHVLMWLVCMYVCDVVVQAAVVILVVAAVVAPCGSRLTHCCTRRVPSHPVVVVAVMATPPVMVVQAVVVASV